LETLDDDGPNSSLGKKKNWKTSHGAQGERKMDPGWEGAAFRSTTVNVFKKGTRAFAPEISENTSKQVQETQPEKDKNRLVKQTGGVGKNNTKAV